MQQSCLLCISTLLESGNHYSKMFGAYYATSDLKFSSVIHILYFEMRRAQGLNRKTIVRNDLDFACVRYVALELAYEFLETDPFEPLPRLCTQMIV